MSDSHPYISGPGNIAQMVLKLQNSFPATVTSDTVKRLGLASNNESYVINALHFIGVIDEEGKKTDQAAEVFSHHKKEDFESAFKKLVQKAYHDLFDLHGENGWTLDNDALITFFRRADQTSATIGKRQAGTFKIFSALSGYGDLPSSRPTKTDGTKKKITKTSKAIPKTQTKTHLQNQIDSLSQNQPSSLPANTNPTETNGNFGLSVRVEINLPSDGSKETYDNIFKSIKENLLNG